MLSIELPEDRPHALFEKVALNLFYRMTLLAEELQLLFLQLLL